MTTARLALACLALAGCAPDFASCELDDGHVCVLGPGSIVAPDRCAGAYSPRGCDTERAMFYCFRGDGTAVYVSVRYTREAARADAELLCRGATVVTAPWAR